MKGESSDKTQPAGQNTIHSIAMTPTIIATLQNPYQTAVYLHCIEKWSYAAIARHLDRPEGTVKSYVNRGRKLLQASALSCEERADRYAYTGPYRAKIILSEFVVNTLREPYQTAIRLHYMEKLTYAAMAKHLRLPKGTVKSQVSRGRKYLLDTVFLSEDDSIA